MCILALTPEHIVDSGRGWKVMSRDSCHSNRYTYSTVYNNRYKHHEVGCWYDAENTIVLSGSAKYVSGYHVFTDLQDARAYCDRLLVVAWRAHWVVVEVEFAGGRVAGIEEYCMHPVIVADRMRILPDEEKTREEPC